MYSTDLVADTDVCWAIQNNDPSKQTRCDKDLELQEGIETSKITAKQSEEAYDMTVIDADDTTFSQIAFVGQSQLTLLDGSSDVKEPHIDLGTNTVSN